jgi:peptidoglycan-N-acetylglucosamine deacetylase
MSGDRNLALPDLSPLDRRDPQISVISPCIDANQLYSLLQSLNEQTIPPEQFELILASPAPEQLDKVLATFAAAFAVTMIEVPGPRPGFHSAGVARNRAVTIARGELIVFVDADCALGPDTLRKHAQLIAVDPKLVICGSTPELEVGNHGLLTAGHYEDFWILLAAAGPDYRESVLPNNGSQQSCGWEQFYSCNASLHKSIFELVRGFDENGYRCHDLDLGYRLSKEGCHFLYSQDAVAIHFEHPRSVEHRHHQALGWRHLADQHEELRPLCDERILWLKQSYAGTVKRSEKRFSDLMKSWPGLRYARRWLLPSTLSHDEVRRHLADIAYCEIKLQGATRWQLRLERNCWDYDLLLPHSNDETPEIAVIIPCYNAVGTIRRALRSVFDQTDQRFEVIVVDDASTDRSTVEIDDFAADGRLRILCRASNGGMSRALNDGLHMVRAPIVVHLDADDWLEASALATVINTFQASSGLVATFANPTLVGPGSYREQTFGEDVETAADCLAYHTVQAPRAYRTDALRKIGGWAVFDAFRGRYYEDRRTLARIADLGPIGRFVGHHYNVSVHRESLSRRSPITTASAKLAILYDEANFRSRALHYRYDARQLKGWLTDRAVRPANQVRWSVVIPAHGRAELLELALRSWLRVPSVQLEIIVVDDGSAQALEQLLAHVSGPIRFLRNDEPQGAAFARNLGARAATAEYLFFSDSDHIVSPDTLALHEIHHASEEPKVVVGNIFGTRSFTHITPDLEPTRKEQILELLQFDPAFEHIAARIALRDSFDLVPPDSVDPWAAAAKFRWTDSWLSAWGAILLAYGEDLEWYPHAWTRVNTGSLSIRRLLFEQLEGFDQRFFSMEDWEFGARLQTAGIKIQCAPEAEPIHQIHAKQMARATSDRCAASQLLQQHTKLVSFLVNPATPVPSPAQAVIASHLAKPENIQEQLQIVRRADDPFALTFDDGPNLATTPMILASLARERLSATFFVLGSGIAGNENLLREIVQQGHEVAVHGWHHTRFDLMSMRDVRRDIARTIEAINSVTGIAPKWLRPPYGLTTPATAAIAREFDLGLAFWDVSSEDWRGIPVRQQIAKLAVHGVAGATILCHDGSSDPKQLDDLIAWLGATARMRGLAGQTLSKMAQIASIPQPEIHSPPTWP